jgi:hypothetical protein
MSGRDTSTLTIWSERIDPHTPEFRPVTDPAPGVMLPDRVAEGSDGYIVGWASVRE